MIELKPNANEIIKSMIFGKGVRAHYLSVCEQYTKGHTQVFSTEFQILVTKLGIVISKASYNPVKISTCYSSINYLCDKVLNNSSLKQEYNKLGINTSGNVGKHNITTVNVNMDKCVNLYNDTVKKIVSKYNLSILNNMLVKKQQNTERDPHTQEVMT